VRKPPFDIPQFTLAMRWHLRLDRDPGFAWLREQIRAAVPD
jgi:hypothetical protein